jgi:Bacterial conjugation TrbI-like protein
MNINDNNGNGSRRFPIKLDESSQAVVSEVPPSPPDTDATNSEAKDEWVTTSTARFATRAGIKGTEGIGKSKLVLLGGGLAAAVLLFVFTALVGKAPKKQAGTQPTQQAKQEGTKQSKGSVTPVMETVRTPAPDNSSGQLGPNDIRRTRSSDGGAIPRANTRLPQTPGAAKAATVGSLGNVPSFADTQQKWEEPQPYGETSPASTSQVQQQQNGLKEPSLIFVRSQVQNQPAAIRANSDDDGAPLLEMTPGTRIQAKLQSQISSAVQDPVVAVVEYTYAIGDKIIVPAGARIYGQLVQADRSGLVNVKFDEIELLDKAREKIDAIGLGLDLGPIKGDVYGKNTGKNFLVRAGAGLGSVLAEIAGNNSSSAFSEDDMLRERVAENIGTAGDSEVMNLNANSRVIVSVPAGREIYIVFTKHEEKSPELHKVASAVQ